MKKLLSVLLCLLLFSGCGMTKKRYYAVYTDVFDTVTEFTAYCESEEQFDEVSETVHAELQRLHEIFDIYNTYPGLANAKTLNDRAGEAIDAPEELIYLCEQGIKWHSETGGVLNIALGPVLSLWHDCREAGILPDEAELKRRAELCDIGKIYHESPKIGLSEAGMSLDFGALAKGYAAEKAADLAEEAGVTDFAISCGGNVVTRGKKPSGSWEIGIENPDGGLLTTVRVSGEAVVTSGDYQRYVEINGKKYHHIIDPQTLFPAEKWRSVTVIMPSSEQADALSTSLFCLNLEDGQALLDKYGGEALWVSGDGECFRSPGFGAFER